MNTKTDFDIRLYHKTFKLDKANAWAMIEGFGNEKTKQAIYCIISRDKNWWSEGNYRLLSFSLDIPFKNLLSNLGKPFIRYQNPPLKYIAVCDTIYQINNDIELWNILCNNDIFDIWQPEAPEQRFSNLIREQDYFISLLRIFEIDYEFDKQLHLKGGKAFNPHEFKDDYLDLLDRQITNSIIDDLKFNELKTTIENLIQPFFVNKFEIENTIEGLEDFDEENSEKKEFTQPQIRTAENIIDKYCKLLQNCKPQIILQGAPGTGKTYTAEKIAKKLTENETGEYKIIQFHPAYSYEDFVRGIVAKSVNNGIIYEVENKILLEFVDKALKEKEKKFVLILDEINRANLPSVLGELIFALEYRNKFVDCLYKKDNNNKIKLPENLFIIGTMNTADRSVGNIDYAIRRRFAFVTLKADKNIIKKTFLATYKQAVLLFEQVERLFFNNVAPDYNKDDVMIGHSYFLSDTLEKLNLKLEYEIKPILREYAKDGILIDKNIVKISDEIEKLKL